MSERIHALVRQSHLATRLADLTTIGMQPNDDWLKSGEETRSGRLELSMVAVRPVPPVPARAAKLQVGCDMHLPLTVV